ncbi:peptidoglycan-binding protein [Sulfobacillus harzensis]|uniref:LysM peptidoglycan-binding domain-containing protein n=1 Tax=Sulfobacillus harzensis TaxID=2729629 RepID=A0A7Y0L5H7_9FIRM|nr:peptidoglycan-binding protein [Sulfobacillus harzensis]NMP23332.1 LysM peptidoglycan-binding domain-containing protein [Sulfobacillus harzensis]
MASNLGHVMSSILSIALVTSGGGSANFWQVGHSGYTVAEIQADLGVLGFNAGAVNGRVSGSLLQAADDYAAAFGLQSKAGIKTDLAVTLKVLGTVPSGTHGTVVLAVESDLKTLGLYHGPLNGQWSSALETAIKSFQTKLGQPGDGVLSAATLQNIAHLTAVRVTAQHHWSYQAQAGDTLRALAFAAGLPYQGFLNANNEHGSSLWAGQTIHWTTASAKPSKPAQSPSPTAPNHKSPPSSPTLPASPPSTGVLANLKPVADLVLLNPRTAEVRALIRAEESAHVSLDVSVSGQWALTHANLMQTLSRLGNELDLSGYSGENLNQLPGWGVQQELSWGMAAFQKSTGSAPTFLIMRAQPNQTVKQDADKLHLVAMAPNQVIRAQKQRTATTIAALLAKPNQVVEVTVPLNWSGLFHTLKGKGFVFETLGQIWAGE